MTRPDVFEAVRSAARGPRGRADEGRLLHAAHDDGSTAAKGWGLVIDQIPDAVSLHDPEGAYVFASHAFTDLFGWQPEQLVGRDAYLLFHPDDVAHIRETHATVLEGIVRASVQYRLRCADGSYQWVETSTRLDGDGQIVAVTRPITDRRSLLHALDNERMVAERLRDVDRERQAFLTAIAHRARHPMTALSGFAQLLQAGRVPDPDARREIYDRLVANCERLSELIEAATTADELSRHAAELRRGPVDIARLAREIAGDYWDLDERATTVTLELPARALVFADRQRLGVALRALYHNAVKHTPVGTAVRIAVEPHPAGQVLVVEDDGPGVPDARKSTVFGQLAHGEAGTTHPNPGLGLGLYLVDQVARAHGGHAWVEDRDGGGACFRILIPSTDPAGTGRTDADR